MNIKSDFEQQDPSANQIMGLAMEYIWDNFIAPKQSEIDEEGAEMLSVIGLSLKHIAEQATAMEKLQKNLGDNGEDISLN